MKSTNKINLLPLSDNDLILNAEDYLFLLLSLTRKDDLRLIGRVLFIKS